MPSDGVLDPTFGGAGVIVGTGENTTIDALAVQGDGRIMAAVAVRVPGVAVGSPSLVRYLPDGNRDSSIGNGGVVDLQTRGLASFTDLAVQPDGKILVTISANGFAVARLTSNGILDPSFGTGGVVQTALGSGAAHSEALALLPDGKIVVVGTAPGTDAGGHVVNSVALARYTSAGALDTAFGDGGTVVTPFQGESTSPAPTVNAEALCLALQANGGIVVGGSQRGTIFINAFVARYTAAGALDSSFGDEGKTLLGFGGSDSNITESLAVQSDGRIVAGGSRNIRPSQIGFPINLPVDRLNPDGSPDETFQTAVLPAAEGGDFAGVPDLALGADGKIVFTASGSLLAGRLNTDGSLDATFGTGGLAHTPLGTQSEGLAVAIQPDGRIVVGGSSLAEINSLEALARFTATSPPLQIFPSNTGDLFMTGTDAGGGPNVLAFAADGGAVRFNFFAFAPDLLGGVRVAAGDVTGDGVTDIIAAAGPGGAPDVHVYDGTTGQLRRQFFAFGESFFGGLYVASGDVNADGFADVVIGADAGGGANVAIFDGKTTATGQPITQLVNFFPYGQAFTGGVRVAAGDVNADGHADLVCGAGPGGGPNVSVISGADGKTLLGSFFPYDMRYTGGLYMAAGDVNGDGRADIITGTGPGGGPNVAVVSGADFVTLLSSFFAYDQRFSGGVRVGAADRNGDGKVDILCVPGPGGGPDVRTVNGLTGTQLDDFFAYAPQFTAGLFVAGSGT